MARQIALLRGINLGSNRRVSMPELRALLDDRGYAGVRTLLQSGNIVLTSRARAATLERDLRAHIADGLGIDCDVVVRTRDELAAVIERNPLGDVADDPKRYTVAFLGGEPDPAGVAEIAAADVAPERFAADGRELYTWHPGGIQQSQLAKLLTPKRLGVTLTVRNWNTVTKLLALADETS
jgi:uncharacterized protein (DUF1697 family)